MQTHIAETIDITSSKAKYDASVKEILADKQILSRIIKYALDDFANEELSDIMKIISDISISDSKVDPGRSDAEKVTLISSEDSVPGEGTIYYDIRFTANCMDSQEKIKYIKYLINIEAQKSSESSSLRYHIDNRVIYYLSRMISSQKGVEFSNIAYDDIKPVRSIWICMDSKDDDDSINKISFEQSAIYGNKMTLDSLDKMQAVIIRLRGNEEAATSKNKLIAMLEDLLRKEPASVKKKKLKEVHGIEMNRETEGRVNVMCNLSDLLEEKGIEKGIEAGIEKGIEKGIEALILDNMEENKDFLTIKCKLMKRFNLTEEAAAAYLEKYGKN